MNNDLLPGEALWNFEPGERVTWSRQERGGYGFRVNVPATVVKRTKYGYTIKLGDGKTVNVRAMNLSRIEAARRELSK